jgi:hypothetical protein
MKYAVDMGSGAMISIPSFIKLGSGIEKLIGGHTQTAWRLHTSIFIFFKNKEIRLNGKAVLGLII